MTSNSLFKPMRTCICCKAESLAHAPAHRRPIGEPTIISIAASIYYRGSGKCEQKAARSIQICEKCFVRAIVHQSGNSKEQESLTQALNQSLSESYNTIQGGI